MMCRVTVGRVVSVLPSGAARIVILSECMRRGSTAVEAEDLTTLAMRQAALSGRASFTHLGVSVEIEAVEGAAV